MPDFVGFLRFIEVALLSRFDLLPPEPARHSALEGKNRKVGTKASFSEFLLVFWEIYAIVGRIAIFCGLNPFEGVIVRAARDLTMV